MMSGEVIKPDGQMTLSELIETGFLICSKCQSHYRDPRLLPCLHTFCRECIQEMKSTENQTGNQKVSNISPDDTDQESIADSDLGQENVNKDDQEKGTNNFLQTEVTLTCPICKSSIQVATSKSADFPSNIFMKDLCELYNYKQNVERGCDYCSYDGRTSTADATCLDCHDNMCQSCTAAHKRTKVTRGHKVIPYVHIQKGLYDKDLREHQFQPCQIHSDEPLTMFCEKCELPMCKECKVETHDNHRSCNLETALSKYQPHMKNLLGGIQMQVPSIINYIQFLSNYDQSVDRSRAKRAADIEEQAQLLHKMIEKQKATYLEALNNACDEERCELQVKSSNLRMAQNSLQNNEQYLRLLLQHGKPDEILLLRQEITKRLTQLKSMQLDGVSTKLRMDYVKGNSSERNIQAVFGKMSIDHTPLGHSDDGLASGMALQITSILPNVKSVPEFVTDFDAEGKADGKEVWPTGIAISKYDEFVIVDRDNKKIKVYNNQGKLLREFTGKGEHKLGAPFDAAVLQSGYIAVTDHEAEDVKVFKSDGEHAFTIKENIKYPRGITVNSKGEIIVLDCQLRQLTVHDPSTGDRILTIEGKDRKGGKVLIDPYYVTASAQDNLIITDSASPNIKVFGPKGDYLANYGHYGLREDEILQPYGVCCDEYGYIFVADNKNHRIHLLLPDGKFSKFLITKNDSLWHPMGVAVTQKGYLIITEALGKVKLFKYI